MPDSTNQDLQNRVTDLVSVKVFNEKTLNDVLTELYNNIQSDRKIAITTIDSLKEQLALNPENIHYLKLEELKHLRESTEQTLKLVTHLKDILLKTEDNEVIGGLLISEEERRYYLEDGNNSPTQLLEEVNEEDNEEQ